MDHSFKWEAPPLKRSGQHAKAYKLAKRLAQKPNQWARIAKYKSYNSAASRASNIRTGKIDGFAEVGTFQAYVRQLDTGEHGLWVRCTKVNKEERRVEPE